MPFARFLFSPRRLVLLFAAAALSLAGIRPASGQALHFVPTLDNVTSINPTSTTTTLNSPGGVATDLAGNLYVIDTNNRWIRKVDPTNTASVFAGTSSFGNTGDGGQANLARFETPYGIATDLAGNVYISDYTANVVRRVSPWGIITTVAGNATPGAVSSGDGGLATAAQIKPAAIATDFFGNLFIVDLNTSTVRVVDAASGNISTYAGGGSLTGHAGDNGPATLARINPAAIATDASGNLYIADGVTIREVDRVSGTIFTVAGNGVNGNSGDGSAAVNAALQNIQGITVDTAGNIFLGDGNARTVRMIDTSNIITTVAGIGFAQQLFSGPFAATRATIDRPNSLSADAYGNVYISVAAQNAVYRLAMHPEVFPQTKVGSQSATRRLILQNKGSSTITLSGLTLSSDYKQVPQNGGTQCSHTTVLEVSSNSTCNIDVSFQPTAEGIRAFPLTITSNDTPTTTIQTLTSTGLGAALAMSSGQMFMVAGNHKNPAPADDGVGGPALSAALNGLNGIAVDSAGNIFFSEYTWCQVLRVDGQTGILSVFAGAHPTTCNTFSHPVSGDGILGVDANLNGVASLTIDSHNNLFVSDTWDSRIRIITPGGVITNYAGNGVGSGNIAACSYTGDGFFAVDATFCNPNQVAIDTAGNVFVADTGNNVIRKITPAGILTTVAGNHALGAGFSGDGGDATAAQLNQPIGLAVNSAGDLFIADTSNNVIRKVTAATGKISTLAGRHGVTGYSGDGTSSTSSTLWLPTGLSMDAAGDLFIADMENMVIRKIDTAGIITTVAGNHQVFDGFNADGLPATSTDLAFPNYITVASSGYLYISDASNGVIREMSPNGSLLFPTGYLHVVSAPESVTLSNIGNMPMHFDPQFPTGVSGDFALASGGTCDFTATLAVGASCTVNITFDPTFPGVRNGIFGFFDDGVASPQYVALQGTGKIAPVFTAQTIHFDTLTNHLYGDPNFVLSATASSGLPVTFSITAGTAASVSGSVVSIHGIGSVTITATQAGDSTYSPISASQTIDISPAVITVTSHGTSQAGQPLAVLTPSYSGFVYGENAGVISGAPVLTTTATPASPANTYPIHIAPGTLHAANYVFSLIDGTYILTPAPPPPPPPTIIITSFVSLQKQSSGAYVGIVTVKNTGTGAASNVTMTSAKLGGTVGVVNPTMHALPINLGTIPAGGQAGFELIWPASAGASGANVLQQITGTYTGGSFGGTLHVNLP